MKKSIGARIKELRIKAGLTQDQLGEKVGVKKAAINKYENGTIENIKRSMQILLADALHTDPVRLFYPEYASDVSFDLSDDERKLIEDFRRLTDEDREEIAEIINLKLQKSKYQEKENSVTIA